MKNVLASQTGIAFVIGHLIGSGAMCPDCVHGTRVISKRWAQCKNCGRKVERPAKTNTKSRRRVDKE